MIGVGNQQMPCAPFLLSFIRAGEQGHAIETVRVEIDMVGTNTQCSAVLAAFLVLPGFLVQLTRYRYARALLQQACRRLAASSPTARVHPKSPLIFELPIPIWLWAIKKNTKRANWVALAIDAVSQYGVGADAAEIGCLVTHVGCPPVRFCRRRSGRARCVAATRQPALS